MSAIRNILLTFIVLALVMSFIPLSTVADDEHSNKDKEKNGTGEGQPEEVTEKLLAKAAEKGLFGRWNGTDGGMEGKFLSLNFTEEGNITDFQLISDEGYVPLISLLNIEDLDLSTFKSSGSILKIGKDPLKATFHDNPTGLVHIFANDTTTVVHILFDSGIDVLRVTDPSDVDDDVPNAIYLNGSSIRGIIKSENATYTIEESDGRLWINATIGPVDDLMIRFQPMVGERNGQTEEMILEAILNDQIAGEVTLTEADDGMVYEEMEYDPELFLDVLETGPHQFKVSVTSERHEGKVFVITADSDSFGDRTRLQITLDGQALSDAGAIDDVLHAQETAEGQGCYAISQTGDIMQVLVFVPSFSTHEIGISLADPVNEDLPLALAFAGAAAIVALAGYLAFRRR